MKTSRFTVAHTLEPQDPETLPSTFNRLRLPHLHMEADPALDCEVYEDPHSLFIVLGHVYEEHLSIEKLEIIFRGSSYPPGAYALFKYRKDDHGLEVIVDRYGVFPLFKESNAFASFYSNRFDDLLKLPSLHINYDPDALRFFLLQGYTRPGDTFFKGLKKIVGSPPEAHELPRDPLDDESWLNQFDLAFKGALSDIIQYGSIKDFRLSGGLDTRVISLCLKSMGMRPETVTVIQSPFLPQGFDQDVELAGLLCDRMGWDLRILSPGPEEYEYSFSSGPVPGLSGVYGGEFFGGQCLKEMPTPIMPDRAGQLQAIDIFLNSFRSTIYNNTWRSPYANHYKMSSPFADSRVLDLIVQLNPSSLLNYQIYHKYYTRICGEFKDIPLCSMLYYWFDDLPRPNPALKNPKHVSQGQTKKLNPDVYETKLYKTALEIYHSEVREGNKERLSNVAFLAQGLKELLPAHYV